MYIAKSVYLSFAKVTQMQCEMCGSNVPAIRKVRIEGILMEVCSKCARFGEETAKKGEKKVVPSIVTQRLQRREKRPVYRDIFDEKDVGEILVEDYPKRITQARNSKKMTKKELAARLNEKLSVIHKLERGDFRPNEKLIRKLEKELEILLREKITDEARMEKKPYSQGITLGDLINLK